MKSASRDLWTDRAEGSSNARYRGWISALLALLMLGAAGGCANKAKLIQAGAKQFEAEALASIDKLDEARLRETSIPAPAPGKAEEQFVNDVLNWEGSIGRKDLDQLLNPDDLGELESETEWQKLLATLRMQYREFAATFANLDQGFLPGAPTVKKAIPMLDPLIGQMSAFAQVMTQAPVEFLGERAALAGRLEDVRDSEQTEEEKHLVLGPLRRQLVKLTTAEKELNKAVIAQCLKTATLGYHLRGLLQDYGKLSIDDITDGLKEAFALTNAIPGSDPQELHGRVMEFMDKINKNPDLKKVLDESLGKIPLS